jgi:hypothetical protein
VGRLQLATSAFYEDKFGVDLEARILEGISLSRWECFPSTQLQYRRFFYIYFTALDVSVLGPSSCTHLCESVFRLRNFNIVGFYYLCNCATCLGHTTIFKYTHLCDSVFRLRNFNIVGFLHLFYCATCFCHTTIFMHTHLCESVFRLRNFNIVGLYYLFSCATCFGPTTIVRYTFS